MRKRIIISIFLIITIFQLILPIKINAFTETIEITSTPGKIQKYNTGVNSPTGLDVKAGVILEPTVAFVTVIVDAISGILNSFMMQEEFKDVMLNYEDELPPELKIENPEEGITTIILDETEMENYKRWHGFVELEYPYFSYSPEEIFAGKVDILNIDFISGKDFNGEIIKGGWADIRFVISEWYKVLRMVTIVGLLAVLIYTGIKIIISSTSKDKAKYKEMILNWFIAVVLAFTMHYIMAFILSVIKEITALLSGITGEIQVVCEGANSFKTNLIGFARFQIQQINFSAKLGHLVIYTALVTYTFKFTFIYFKRVLRMAFLTVISPIVALTYPLDKMDGKAKGFEMWLKEYMYNALLQLMHYILYYILVTTSLTLAVRNPIYGIVALMFISQAEKLLKKIFGFGKASAGTVGGLAGAFATGAVTSKVTNMVRDPLHPFGGGKGESRSSGGKGSKSDNYSEGSNQEPSGIKDDINVYDFIGSETGRSGKQEEPVSNPMEGSQGAQNTNSNVSPTPNSNGLDIDDTISGYRRFLSQYSDEDLGELDFDEGDPIGNIDGMIGSLSEYQSHLKKSGKTPAETLKLNDALLDLRDSSVFANEVNFPNLQYIDGDSRNTSDIIDDIIRLNTLANDKSYSASDRRRYAKEARRLLKLVKRRMLENQYIEKQGGLEKDTRLNNMNQIMQSYSQYQVHNLKNVPEEELEKRLIELKESLPIGSSSGTIGSMGSLIDEIIRFNQIAHDTSLDESTRKNYAEKVKKGLNELNTRMSLNNVLNQTNNEETVRTEENNAVNKNPARNADTRFRTVGTTVRQRATARENARAASQLNSNRIVTQANSSAVPVDNTQGNAPVNPRAVDGNTIIPPNRVVTQNPQQKTKREIKSPVARGLLHVGKSIIKPVWDVEKEDNNGLRLAGNVFKGALGVTLGISAAVVQAGISITDGKYNPIEGFATIGAAMKGVSSAGRKVEDGVKDIARTYREGVQEGATIEDYSRQWYNRDDIISSYNREYPGRGKEMRQRAVNNYVSRGITEFSEQKKAIKYAEVLRQERGMSVEEADRLAAATLRYRQKLARSKNYYNILNNKQKRNEYIDGIVEIYSGSKSLSSVRKVHEDFIQNVREFDEANR